MAKPVIYKRNDLGRALTFTEVDSSLQNLRDSTISVSVTGSETVVNDLNDTTTLVSVDGISITAVAATKTISFDAAVVNDLTPELGGDLDVGIYSIVSSSNGDITLAPDGTGKVIISGDLQVDGTTTTINSTTVDIDDINITLAKGSISAAASNGGGITLEGPTPSATILYQSADDSWAINKDLDINDLDIMDASGIAFNTVTEQNHTAGRIYWDPVDGTLAVGMEYDEVVGKVGMNLFYHVKNQTGSTISKGTLVMAVGTLGSSGQILCAPAVTDGSVDPRYMLGVTNMEIANGGDGYAVHFGLIKGIDTRGPDSVSDWSDGTVLWNNPTVNGALQDTEPMAPDLKLAVAYVINAAENGSMFVRATTGLKLQDLHDVDPDGATNGQALIYNSSLGIWEPGTITSGIANVVEDTTPQLGGDLDTNGSDIIMGSNSVAVTSWDRLMYSRLYSYVEAYSGPTTTSGTIDIDGEVNLRYLTMNGNVTFTESLERAQTVTFVINQDATGSRTITFPAGSIFANGDNTINTAANSTTVITFLKGTSFSSSAVLVSISKFS